MSDKNVNMYDFSSCIADIYDQQETDTCDVDFIRRLLGGLRPLRILEPFCGTGRITLPLASEGHTVTGLDSARGMLTKARAKLAALSPAVQARVEFRPADVIRETWSGQYDLVLLGGNCFYELATPDEQERCIAQAAHVLPTGGHVYVDNDHMEGLLHPSWQSREIRDESFPTGVCCDGTRVYGSMQTVWHDAAQRLVRIRRHVVIVSPDGRTRQQTWIQQKHPVSAVEVKTWLTCHGFHIEGAFGDRTGAPYCADSPRAVFWACKTGSSMSCL